MAVVHTSLKISGIRISCSKSKKLRVVVSVKSTSTQGKALQLLDAQSEEKKDQLFRQISPSCVLEAGCQFTIAVYELHSWRSDKKLGEQGFSFDTLRQVSSSPSESEVYELFSKDGVVMSVKLEQDQAEGAKASESGAKGRNGREDRGIGAFHRAHWSHSFNARRCVQGSQRNFREKGSTR
ncbi:hypothetical protein DFH08DRAFT_209898 [Mycena albidolilacea]|uniref:Uncharacterized protein n=1 Tax=Mycena albidolilacea TaxID=1033008 RepID=A0AAD7A0M6_9AGAR|nr:hypothetical protein DFH08DRAFT_209898 [Mycena albidolilacea]